MMEQINAIPEQIKMMFPTSFQGDYVFYPIFLNFAVLGFCFLIGLISGFIPKSLKNKIRGSDKDLEFALLILQAVTVLIGFFGYLYYNDPSFGHSFGHLMGLLMVLAFFCLPLLLFFCGAIDALFLGVGFLPGWLTRKFLWFFSKKKGEVSGNYFQNS